MATRSWFFAVSLLALLGGVARFGATRGSPLVAAAPSGPGRSPPGAALGGGPRASAPALVSANDGGPSGVVDPGPDLDAEWRRRSLASPAFGRLPAPDQRWVLMQARSRTNGPDDPQLAQVVQELSEVRLFAVSEREDPLPFNPSRQSP